jgi:hypothetical protein
MKGKEATTGVTHANATTGVSLASEDSDLDDLTMHNTLVLTFKLSPLTDQRAEIAEIADKSFILSTETNCVIIINQTNKAAMRLVCTYVRTLLLFYILDPL